MPARSPGENADTPLFSSRFTDVTVRKVEDLNAADYGRLSERELEETFQTLTEPTPDAGELDRLERLVHEMQVYRCELEMQNRALRESQEQIERAIYRYTELYDSLPLGYITLTPTGQITEANETACRTLHLDRSRLKGAYLRQFIAPGDACAFAAHLAACNRSALRQVMETT